MVSCRSLSKETKEIISKNPSPPTKLVLHREGNITISLENNTIQIFIYVNIEAAQFVIDYHYSAMLDMGTISSIIAILRLVEFTRTGSYYTILESKPNDELYTTIERAIKEKSNPITKSYKDAIKSSQVALLYNNGTVVKIECDTSKNIIKNGRVSLCFNDGAIINIVYHTESNKFFTIQRDYKVVYEWNDPDSIPKLLQQIRIMMQR